MGGIVDPEGQRALVYRKTTQVETVDPGKDSGFQRKKIKKVTSESSWIGTAKEGKAPLLAHEETEDVELQPWHDQEVETNPLYTSSDYVSDFNNPLYAPRLSTTEAGAMAAASIPRPPRRGDGRATHGKPSEPEATPQSGVDTYY